MMTLYVVMSQLYAISSSLPSLALHQACVVLLPGVSNGVSAALLAYSVLFVFSLLFVSQSGQTWLEWANMAIIAQVLFGS